MTRKLRGLWTRILTPTEERRGKDDSVKDLFTVRISSGRYYLVFGLLMLGFLALVVRLAWLQLGFNTDFLKRQGDLRFQRTIEVPAMRGQILDRNGSLYGSFRRMSKQTKSK